MPISRILVLDYHASLRTSLFPKTKRRVRTFFPFSLSLFIFILFLGREGGRDGLADRIELVDI